MFSKSMFFSGLLIAALAVGAHLTFIRLPDREDLPPAMAEIIFVPAALPQAFGPLRVAGAWRLTSREPRLGGVSALALDRGELLALTDSGVVIRLPKPRPGSKSGKAIAEFRDLPTGPGSGRFKARRDSEALAKSTDGWWVAFENRHSVWRYDRDFRSGGRHVGLGQLGWRNNKGAEGMLATADGLLLLPEGGDEMVRVRKGEVERIGFDNSYGRLADATTLPDGRIVVLARNFSPAGFSAKLLLLEGARLTPVATLKLGRLANPEAIAAETLPSGMVRLWLMTDNDYRRRVPTLLVALDWTSPEGPDR